MGSNTRPIGFFVGFRSRSRAVAPMIVAMASASLPLGISRQTLRATDERPKNEESDEEIDVEDFDEEFDEDFEEDDTDLREFEEELNAEDGEEPEDDDDEVEGEFGEEEEEEYLVKRIARM